VQGAFTTTVFEAALNACSRGIGIEAAKREIAARVLAGGGTLPPGWIDRNVCRGYEYALTNGAAPRPTPVSAHYEDVKQKPKAVFVPPKLAAFAGEWRHVVDTAWLADRSPIDPCGMSASGFLQAIYEPPEKVIVLDVFASQGQWVWSHDLGFAASRLDHAAWDGNDPQHLHEPPLREGAEFPAAGPQGIWYLCNPVDGLFRKMEEADKFGRPKWSRRWEPCVTDWRYLALESDSADPREWIAAISRLPLPIAAIYTSGGRSIHVLVRVDAKSKTEFDIWRETAKRTMVPLGADPGCMSAVRLTRLPGCLRLQDKDGKPRKRLQKLLFLDPEASLTPLCNRQAVRDTFGPWERWCMALTSGARCDADPDEIEAVAAGLKRFAGERAWLIRREFEKWRRG
jgi:hypothetical protein